MAMPILPVADTGVLSAVQKRLSRHWGTSRERRQVTRFLVIGCCTTATDLTIYMLLTSLGLLSPSPAKGSSYLSAMVFGFFGNKLWAFQSNRRSLDEPLAFFGLYGTTLLVNVGLNALGLAVLGHSVPARLMAFVAATGVTTVLNFLGLRFVAFRRGIEEQALPGGQTAASEIG